MATFILRGEENDVEKVLAEVKDNPALLDEIVTGVDPCGTPVRGNLLQIALMARDIDLTLHITNEKERGLVERLIEVGGLSQERVAKDLECILSPEAKKENQERTQRYLAIVKTFGNFIYLNEGKILIIQYAIDRFNKDIESERSKLVYAGLIFDTKILIEAAKWIAENCLTPITAVNGIALLQKMLSSRDAHVMYAGILYLSFQNEFPERIIKPSKIGTHYPIEKLKNELGRAICLSCCGRPSQDFGEPLIKSLAVYISNKEKSLIELMRGVSNTYNFKR